MQLCGEQFRPRHFWSASKNGAHFYMNFMWLTGHTQSLRITKFYQLIDIWTLGWVTLTIIFVNSYKNLTLGGAISGKEFLEVPQKMVLTFRWIISGLQATNYHWGSQNIFNSLIFGL